MLEVVHLVHVVAASARSVSTGNHDRKVLFLCRECWYSMHQTDLGTRQPIQKNRGAVKSCAGFVYPLKLLEKSPV